MGANGIMSRFNGMYMEVERSGTKWYRKVIFIDIVIKALKFNALSKPTAIFLTLTYLANFRPFILRKYTRRNCMHVIGCFTLRYFFRIDSF